MMIPLWWEHKYLSPPAMTPALPILMENTSLLPLPPSVTTRLILKPVAIVPGLWDLLPWRQVMKLLLMFP